MQGLAHVVVDEAFALFGAEYEVDAKTGEGLWHGLDGCRFQPNMVWSGRLMMNLIMPPMSKSMAEFLGRPFRAFKSCGVDTQAVGLGSG